MGDYQVEAPDGLWEGVEAGLVHGTGSKVRPLFWLSTAAAAALAAFLFLHKESGPANDGFIAKVEIAEPFEKEELVIVDSIEPAKETVSRRTRNKIPFASVPETVNETSAVETEVEEIQTETKTYDQKLTEPDPEEGEAVRKYWDEASGTIDINPSKTGRRFSLLASVAGAEGMKSSFGNYGGFAYSDASRFFVANGGDDLFSPVGSVMLSNLNREVMTEVNHHQPLRYAIEAEHMLTERLGIASGLTYTRLVSDMSSGSSNAAYSTRQKIDYIGIPLYLNCYLLDSRRFNLYISGGGTGEKAVSGTSVTSYEYEGAGQAGNPYRFREKQLQWSVNAALGANLRLIERVKVFVEPGISYYFNNGSDIDNIYKERPLNFNLTLGIRTDFSR